MRKIKTTYTESAKSMNPKTKEMNQAISFKIIVIILLSIISTDSFAQFTLSLYNDIGKNNVSDGLYLKSALIGSWKLRKTTLETGIQADVKNNNHQGFSGYTLNASRIIINNKTSLEIKGFCFFTYPSEIVMESNMGALLKMSHKCFKMEVGTDFKTYNLRLNTASEYAGTNNSLKIREIYNIIYSLNFNVRPTDEKWNMGLTITNIDHFIINQETNPVININGFYKLSAPVKLYAEVWYKCAGATNLALNHFGYFFRTGIIWNIN
jgi:hypothetical protein